MARHNEDIRNNKDHHKAMMSEVKDIQITSLNVTNKTNLEGTAES